MIPFTPTHKLYLPMAAISPLNAASGASTTYYRFNGARVAMRTVSTVYWLHGDHLGSASLTTSITGTTVSELRYTPFGETRYSSGSTLTDRRFTSQEEQVSIGLYLFGSRLYHPQIGRFISSDTVVQDPYDPLALNRYAYARNNPLKYVDPTGHCFLLAGLDTVLCVSAWMMIVGGTGMATIGIMSTPSGRQVQANAQQAASQLAVQADNALKSQSEAPNNENGTNKAVSASGQVGSPTGPHDPNGRGQFDPNNYDPNNAGKIVKSLTASLKNILLNQVSAVNVPIKFNAL